MVASSLAVLRANQLRLYPALLAASAQTTIGGWLALDAAPTAAYQSGSVLFCFDSTKSVKHQLNDAVVLKRAKRNQLRRSSDNNPKGWMMKEVHINGWGVLLA